MAVMSLPGKHLTVSKYNLTRPYHRMREFVDWSASGYILKNRWLTRVEASTLPGMSTDKVIRGMNEGELKTKRRHGVLLYDRESIIAYLQLREGLPRSLRQCPTCHGIFASTEDCPACDQ